MRLADDSQERRRRLRETRAQEGGGAYSAINGMDVLLNNINILVNVVVTRLRAGRPRSRGSIPFWASSECPDLVRDAH
jgi:hypothetical protein